MGLWLELTNENEQISERTVTVRQVLELLTTEDFSKWYQRQFNDWLTGNGGCPTDDQILRNLAFMMQ
mgnify:CR=1 FL=1